jgi:hypothetical protein
MIRISGFIVQLQIFNWTLDQLLKRVQILSAFLIDCGQCFFFLTDFGQ